MLNFPSSPATAVWLPAVCTALLVSGCASGSSDGTRPTAVVRDSAGIQIVENPAVEDGELPFWAVDTVPAFTIGQLDGDPAYEFEAIHNVTQLANGMIVVLEGRGESTNEFRFFDASGRHIATHGRPGQGPGEFQWVNFIGSAGGDTVVAVDFPARRISWLSASAGFVRSAPVDEGRFKRLLGEDITNIAEGMVPLSDSLFATKAWRRKAGDANRFARFTQFDLVDVRNDSVANVGRFDEPVTVQVELSRGPSYIRGAVESSMGLHVVDRQRGRLCAANTGRPELICVSTSGTRRIARWQPPVFPYTAEDRSEYEKRVRESHAKSRGYYAPGDADKIFATMQWPTQFTPIRALQIDSDGNTWVLEYAQGTSSSKGLRFRVLDPRGEQIAFASGFELSPYGLNNPVFISAASIMRRVTNADGVEQIAVFPIRK